MLVKRVVGIEQGSAVPHSLHQGCGALVVTNQNILIADSLQSRTAKQKFNLDTGKMLTQPLHPGGDNQKVNKGERFEKIPEVSVQTVIAHPDDNEPRIVIRSEVDSRLDDSHAVGKPRHWHEEKLCRAPVRKQALKVRYHGKTSSSSKVNFFR